MHLYKTSYGAVLLEKLTVAKLVKDSFDRYGARMIFDVLSMDHALTNSMYTVLLQKLLVSHLTNKFHSLYGNKLFTRGCHWKLYGKVIHFRFFLCFVDLHLDTSF